MSVAAAGHDVHNLTLSRVHSEVSPRCFRQGERTIQIEGNRKWHIFNCAFILSRGDMLHLNRTTEAKSGSPPVSDMYLGTFSETFI